MTEARILPATVIAGRDSLARRQLIDEQLARKPPDERWLLLAQHPAEFTASMAGVRIAAAPRGCFHCAGRVALTTTLARLLRQTPADGVIIEADATAHVDDLRRAFDDPWLARLVWLRELIEADRPS